MSLYSSPLLYPHSHLHSAPFSTFPNLREPSRRATEMQSQDMEAGPPSHLGALGLGFFRNTDKMGWSWQASWRKSLKR